MILPSTVTLRALESAARLESYSAAACELSLTHGAISRRLRALEAEQGQSLFERKGNTMRPTAEGLRLADVARRALATIEVGFGAKRPSAKQKILRPELRISCVPALATRFLSARLGALQERQAGFDVTLLPQFNLADLDNASIDAAIRYGRGPWRGVSQKTCEPHQLLAVCAPEVADCVKDIPLLRHSWRSWTPWLQASGLMRPEPAEGRLFDESDLLLRSAIRGEGLALVAEPFARDDLKSGTLVEPVTTRLVDQNCFHLVWKTESMPQHVAFFGDWFAGQMKNPSN